MKKSASDFFYIPITTDVPGKWPWAWVCSQLGHVWTTFPRVMTGARLTKKAHHLQLSWSPLCKRCGASHPTERKWD